MKRKGMIMILAYLLLFIGGQVALVTFGLPLNQTMLFSFAIQVVLILLGWYLYRDTLAQDWQELKAQTSIKSLILWFIGAFIAMVALRVVTMKILENFMDLSNLAANQQALNELSKSQPLFLTFFMVAIFAPFVEELVFRQAIIGSFDKTNKTLMIILSCLSVVLFTGAHMATLVDATIYLPLSLVIIFFYWKFQGNVLATILFHFFNNFIAIIIMFTLSDYL
ncbi:CPBP family intramembrane glutamic endopeptidase [Facklamia languida]|uniref:CAAX prenyl protease 2/Lysostaphin resistance protein A-like domain-containing protein n=1 Tax=Facklamia languida CCUG 37842 TaxID=883113 RepID=H3NKJ9_9LACT|nr:CPBP family intramembrane glutamic endopeptidase [Facklamia languida]EHR36382.1 hypothetical protein HMPREF9708_01388 [Facklamia languida CCUG 37842]